MQNKHTPLYSAPSNSTLQIHERALSTTLTVTPPQLPPSPSPCPVIGWNTPLLLISWNTVKWHQFLCFLVYRAILCTSPSIYSEQTEQTVSRYLLNLTKGVLITSPLNLGSYPETVGTAALEHWCQKALKSVAAAVVPLLTTSHWSCLPSSVLASI